MSWDRATLKKLGDIVSGKILFDEPMSRHTSIGVGGAADALVLPESNKELSVIIAFLRRFKIPFIPVGNGTNLIVKDGGYRGTVIDMKSLNAVTTERGAEATSIYAGAGVILSEVVALSIEESLTGMEFCAGIPGSVGGAVKMNAGAYGSEIKNIVETIEIMNSSGEIQTVKKDTLAFQYRNLDLPEGAIIIGASFLLTKGHKEEIQGKITEILRTRKKKHPLEYRNAGSIFKNPGSGIPAGRIIDELGLKGMRIGNAKISEKHGNFIVNMGGAKARDIIGLIDMVRKKVKETRGIDLEPEVKIIGEDE